MEIIIDNIFISVIAIPVLICVAIVSFCYDQTIVDACEKNGYWQTKQVRVICAVEPSN